jgi:hypothetical protein
MALEISFMCHRDPGKEEVLLTNPASEGRNLVLTGASSSGLESETRCSELSDIEIVS